jgi:hypothetical protein
VRPEFGPVLPLSGFPQNPFASIVVGVGHVAFFFLSPARYAILENSFQLSHDSDKSFNDPALVNPLTFGVGHFFTAAGNPFLLLFESQLGPFLESFAFGVGHLTAL